MRRVSPKTAARNAEARPFRVALVQRVGRCEVCGHDPMRLRPGWIRWALAVHEIANGADRQKAMDKPYAVLVVCAKCHIEHLGSSGPNSEWPEARQLAVLLRSRPADYDLAAYLMDFHPRAPRAVTQAEVDRSMRGLQG